MGIPTPPEPKGSKDPIGERVEKPIEEAPLWAPVPGKPWLQQHRITKRLRTNLPKPKD